MVFLVPLVCSRQARPVAESGASPGARDARRVVVLSEGLHARPASALARLALGFDAKVTLIRNTYRADAASILELLALGAASGDDVEIETSGPEAEQALHAVRELIENNFDRAVVPEPA